MYRILQRGFNNNNKKRKSFTCTEIIRSLRNSKVIKVNYLTDNWPHVSYSNTQTFIAIKNLFLFVYRPSITEVIDPSRPRGLIRYVISERSESLIGFSLFIEEKWSLQSPDESINWNWVWLFFFWMVFRVPENMSYSQRRETRIWTSTNFLTLQSKARYQIFLHELILDSHPSSSCIVENTPWFLTIIESCYEKVYNLHWCMENVPSAVRMCIYEKKNIWY